MSKKKLFDEEESDEEVEIKTENEYAKKYDVWRGKEEIHKLEQKYGTKALGSDASESSDSEDESDEPPDESEEMETQFLKTLALLKSKDPRIYDSNYKFFEEKEEKTEEEKPNTKSLTFDDSDDDDENDGNIFKVEKKAEITNEAGTSDTKGTDPRKKKTKEGVLKDYLTGKAENVDEPVADDLAPLRALWSDPALNENEAFLRDYILNKRYLDGGAEVGSAGQLRDDEELEEDARRVEEQGHFERAYNFRFEEPDQEFIKRFPRTVGAVRPSDTRRSERRAEVRARKERDKLRKMEEIARLKALKMREIQDKIQRIKQVTGNQELAFEESDVEGDWDPEAHDRRMRALFDEQYYGEVDETKPEFPELDEELEIENWDKYEVGDGAGGAELDADATHCEDENFNMDADYNPHAARATLQQQIQSNLNKKRRNRKRKSKLAQLLADEKPTFVPTNDRTYSEHMEEYYKMDCEDIIAGDLPTRFKYREVVPNDYGLTIEEILLADDRELTQWVPLKRVVKHRGAEAELNDVRNYRQKGSDPRLKRRLLPSLFQDLPEEPEIVVPVEEATKKKKKKKRKKEDKERAEDANQTNESVQENKASITDNNDRNNLLDDAEINDIPKKKKKKDKKESGDDLNASESSDTPNKLHKEESADILNVNESTESLNIKKKKHKKENNVNPNIWEFSEISNGIVESNVKVKKEQIIVKRESKKKKNKKEHETRFNGEAVKKEGNKKKATHDGFIVETVDNQEPSQSADLSNQDVNRKNKGQFHHNKSQNGKAFTKSVKKNKNNFKTKFKAKEKFNQNKNKGSNTENPLNKLSDERLKAYGLNPKKYKNFLKYKKF